MYMSRYRFFLLIILHSYPYLLFCPLGTILPTPHNPAPKTLLTHYEYEQPYYGVLSYLYDIGYTVEYELLQEAHLQDSFDSTTKSVDVKEIAEDGVIHVYSDETGKDVAQIPLTKLAELEKEVKDFVEYKLFAYKVANPTKRSDLLPKSIYAFDIPNEIARVKRYKEYAEYCLKQLEEMHKEG